MMTEVKNGTSSPGQQVINAFRPNGSMSTFSTGLFVPFGIADLQSVTTTPEPATLFLIAGALLWMAWYRFIGRLWRYVFAGLR